MEPSSKKTNDNEPPGFAIKTILIAIVWAVLLASALGFSVKYAIELSQLVTSSKEVAPPHGTIRIGVFNWPGYYPLVTAQELGFFAKRGLKVELVKANTIGELNDWIRTGRTQVSVGVLADFIVLRNLGTPIQMMTATDYSLADVILARSDIKNPRDLTGKRIGLAELNSFAEYFVIRSLELSGVNPRSVRLYTVPVDRVPEAISSGEIDAGHTWEPTLSRGLQRGQRTVLSSAQNPRLVIDGIAFREEVSQDITIPLAVTEAFFEALAILKTDPVSFASIPAHYFGLTREQTQRFIDEDVRFTDLDENIRLYESGGVLRGEADAIVRFFNERGMGGDKTDLKKLIDDSVIRRIEDERAIGAADGNPDGFSTSKLDRQIEK